MATPWDRLLGNRPDESEAKSPFTSVLSRVPIFKNLTRRELISIDRILHRRQYIQNEVIFRQGEPGMGLYVVQSGTVGIVLEPGNQLVFEMRDGDFFGEVTLLDEGPRTATAIAKTNCVLLGFFQSDLLNLIDRNPRLGVKVVLSVARHVAVRLRKADELVAQLTEEIEALSRKQEPDER